MNGMRSRGWVLVIVLFASLVLVEGALGATYDKCPTDDTCCRHDYPNTAGVGDAPLLYVGGPFEGTGDFWTTYIKFDLSDLSPGGTVNSAELRMVCFDCSAGVTVQAFEVMSDSWGWQEDTWCQTYADDYFTINWTACDNTEIPNAGAHVTWDVTWAASQHLGGDFTIVLEELNQPSAGDWAKFYSKDQTYADKPRLVLSYTPPGPTGPLAYINFGQGAEIIDSIQPIPYTNVEAYVCLDRLEEGMTAVSLALGIDPQSIAVNPVFMNLLPGGMTIGEWSEGVTMASTECVGLDRYPVSVCVLSFLYIGGEGDILLLDHPEYPRWVVDCEEPGQVHYYCVLNHGGIGKSALPGDCGGATPVQATSWGNIKSLYR